MFNVKIIKRHLGRYVSRLKKSLRKHRRWYATALPDVPRRPQSGSTTSIGDLPVEVFAQVIAVLDSRRDKESMAACSLVSRRWRAVALPYLFSTVSVAEEEDFDKFLAFLAETPHVTQQIRSLSLWGEGGSAARLDCTAFSRVFPSLTRLRRLFLDCLTLQVTGIGVDEGSFRHNDSSGWLEALEVDDVCCEDMEGRRLPVIPTVLDMLPVTSVHLLRFDRLGDAVAKNKNSDFEVGQPSRSIAVGHLAVVAPEGAATPAYFAFYEKLVHVGSLGCISVFCSTWEDAEQLTAFLRVQGSSVTTVDLDVTELLALEREQHLAPPLPPRRWQHLAQSLPACANLSSLRLHISWNSMEGDSLTHTSVFSDIFSVTIPPTLREFQLWIKLPEDWGYADAHTSANELWGLSTLDRALCDRDRFPELRRVLVIIQSFPVVPPAWIYALEGRIAERELPRVDGMGILYFQWFTPICYELD
ncbi:hypothetical protein L226DRAFT_82748 [Lentinus tigrinus ALCF2SS1-7]|uniref:F-box domain-containing protein n=1 Tax=Lentinus tigrinus ALCF2SS1-6 TaxID=1328759 RepID=A0A5C2RW47_9APHY|nr:hypothetical protein L227DRAFT_657252 [Lentinus tigrinus ALCF2SS1-6]RPD74116.1 hypothetical protein L226DRAFT_82748 [Lentinus tigrinus ALCF2SS1-7]